MISTGKQFVLRCACSRQQQTTESDKWFNRFLFNLSVLNFVKYKGVRHVGLCPPSIVALSLRTLIPRGRSGLHQNCFFRSSATRAANWRHSPIGRTRVTSAISSERDQQTRRTVWICRSSSGEALPLSKPGNSLLREKPGFELTTPRRSGSGSAGKLNH